MGSAAQFNRSVSARPANAPQPSDAGRAGHGGYIALRWAELVSMLRNAFIILVLALCGCASTRPELSLAYPLAHDVDVPKQYRSGNFSKEHPYYMAGDSAIERYVSAYERGWWSCVRKYAHDIKHRDQAADSAGLGWPEEADGWTDGFLAASDRIQSLISRFGEEKVTEYLVQFDAPYWKEGAQPDSAVNGGQARHLTFDVSPFRCYEEAEQRVSH